MAEKVRLNYVEIMMELDEITKEYSTLLQKANELKTPVLSFENGHKELTRMRERLEALQTPIEQLDSYFERVDANEYLTPLLNAVRSSLVRPLHHL